jgi:hypothetical protein
MAAGALDNFLQKSSGQLAFFHIPVLLFLPSPTLAE